MIMGGIANPLRAAISPHRISQIANKIIPILFVSLMMLTSVCEKCDPYCLVSQVD